MPEPADIRRVHASDARRVRSIRLEALSDSAADIAFLETRASAEAHPDEFWQERTIGAALSDAAAQFIAEEGRDWVATLTVLLPEPGSVDSSGRTHPAGRALLVAVYVRPSRRGRGIIGELVQAAADWARTRGATELMLDVHEHNARARRAYERLGFVATGGTWQAPSGTELEMVREV